MSNEMRHYKSTTKRMGIRFSTAHHYDLHQTSGISSIMVGFQRGSNIRVPKAVILLLSLCVCSDGSLKLVCVDAIIGLVFVVNKVWLLLSSSVYECKNAIMLHWHRFSPTSLA